MRLRLSGGVLDLDEGRFEDTALSSIETRLLRFLAQAERPVSQEELLAEVWGYSPKARSRTVRVTVSRVRQKIEADPRSPRHLLTEHGLGYRLRWVRQATTLVGRQSELRALLDGEGLTTLVGPSGIGKTALARALASQRSGVFVDASTCTSSADLAAAVARELGHGLADDPAAAVRAAQPSLLVLDNLEQVDAPDIVDAWDRGRVVATSLRPLGVEREQILTLVPLADDEAAQLFRSRWAAAGGPDLAPEDAARAIALLDGLPLALELAAAWGRVLRAEELIERLEVDLAFLRDPRRKDRHRSLDAALEGSWALLDSDERALMAQLAVFEGEVPIHAVEEMLGPEALPAVLQLSERALVTGRGRLGIVRSVRLFARERADEDDRRRHAAWLRRRVVDLPERGPESGTTLSALEELREDLRAAWQRGAADDALLGAFELLLRHRGPQAEHLQVSQRLGGEIQARALVLAGRPAEAVEAARAVGAHVTEGGALMRVGRRDEAIEVLSAKADERPWMEAERHRVLGALANQTGRPDDALAHYRAALALAERVGDPRQLPRVMMALAMELALAGEHDDALALSDQAATYDLSGRQGQQLWVQRGRLLGGLGRPEEAIEAFEQSIDAAQGADRPIGIALADIGGCQLALGQDAEAETSLREAVRRLGEHLDIQGNSVAFLSLAIAAQGRREESRAVEASLDRTRGARAFRMWENLIIAMAALVRGEDPSARIEQSLAYYTEVSYGSSIAVCRTLLAFADPKRPVPEATEDPVTAAMASWARAARGQGEPPAEAPRSWLVRFTQELARRG